jgi:hypothetical protein
MIDDTLLNEKKNIKQKIAIFCFCDLKCVKVLKVKYLGMDFQYFPSLEKVNTMKNCGFQRFLRSKMMHFVNERCLNLLVIIISFSPLQFFIFQARLPHFFLNF